MEELIFKVAIVLIIGFIGGKVAERFKLPSVSGYLIFGLFLGPSLGLIFTGFDGFITASDQSSLKFISEIALAFIAFSIGSEFRLKNLKKQGKEVTTIANYEVIGAVIVVFLALFFIPKPEPIMIGGYNPFSKGNIAFGLVLASMSAATAPAATLIVMREYRAYGTVTKTILPVVALDDIHGIIIFGFAISVAKMLVAPGTSGLAFSIAKPFIEVFGSILIGGIIGYLLVLITKRLKKELADHQVISVAAIFLTMGIMMLINKAFEAQSIAMSILLANMMAGAVIANLSNKRDETFKSIDNFTTPFYVLFFTLAGASLDLGILGQGILISILAIVYILARGLGKYFGAYTGAAIAKSPKLVRRNIGFALLPQGGVSLGLLVIVQAQLSSFYPLISTIIMLSILVYETTGPIFAKYAISSAGEINGLDRLEELSQIDIKE